MKNIKALQVGCNVRLANWADSKKFVGIAKGSTILYLQKKISIEETILHSAENLKITKSKNYYTIIENGVSTRFTKESIKDSNNYLMLQLGVVFLDGISKKLCYTNNLNTKIVLE